MFGWLREFLEIRANYHREITICHSCETLKELLAVKSVECERLMNKLLEKPDSTPIETTPVEISRPKVMPWRIKRQLLEAEDRRKAELLRNVPKPDADVTDLEKELGIIEQTQMNVRGSSTANGSVNVN